MITNNKQFEVALIIILLFIAGCHKHQENTEYQDDIRLQLYFVPIGSTNVFLVNNEYEPLIRKAFVDCMSGRGKSAKELNLIVGLPWGRFEIGTNRVFWLEDFVYWKTKNNKDFSFIVVPQLQPLSQKYYFLSKSSTQEINQEQWKMLLQNKSRK